jgi:DNA-binding NarL/FixJ family response regulator
VTNVDLREPPALSPRRVQLDPTRAGDRVGGTIPRRCRRVRLIVRGRSNEEIARILGLSRKTVEAYIRDVFSRHGFSSRTELALWAEREGWLDVPGDGSPEDQSPLRPGMPTP